ncbi:MAG: type I-C CRISPR-associated endonuclease Cas1c [Anaerovoracaceae bacterium]
MKRLLNTLYISNPNRYLSLDGENVVILAEGEEVGRLPLHNLEGIVTFGYTGASPALMGACARNNISLCFMTQHGRFLARVSGEVRGNVILRKEQYRLSDEQERSLNVAKNMIVAKLYNSKWIINRATRDYPMRVDVDTLKGKCKSLDRTMKRVQEVSDLGQLRGLEGEAASLYFSVFDELILQQKENFYFCGRSRRPPLDNTNALLSFSYSLLAGICTSALEAVGLDPYVGFLHRDRPGRASLALDLMEEFRAVMADRFVLTLINKKIINERSFVKKENSAVVLTDEARRTVLSFWQDRKQEWIKHPFLEEKIEWGMAPYVQALLLARYIRGDIDEYPPFLWK